MIHHKPTFKKELSLPRQMFQGSLGGSAFDLPWKWTAIVSHQQQKGNKTITWNHLYYHQSVCTLSLTWLKEESLSEQLSAYWLLDWLCCFSRTISSFLIWSSSNLFIKDSTTMIMVFFKVCIICWYLEQKEVHQCIFTLLQNHFHNIWHVFICSVCFHLNWV